MKIMVVGCGFVGETIAQSLEENGVEIIRIDPKLNDDKIIDYLYEVDGAIVAVPTPTVNGKCDDSIIRQVLDQLGPAIPILLKCTVTPDLMKDYFINVTYNPEFLRAKTAKEDFDNQKFFILGGESHNVSYWRDVFSYMDAEPIITDRTTASMVKYMHNVWLAAKVAFFHEIFSLLGDKYDHDQMIDILGKFENIGPSHMAVQDGLGFGGHCFPKDTEAFYDFSGSDILKKVIEVNEKLRNK